MKINLSLIRIKKYMEKNINIRASKEFTTRIFEVNFIDRMYEINNFFFYHNEHNCKTVFFFLNLKINTLRKNFWSVTYTNLKCYIHMFRESIMYSSKNYHLVNLHTQQSSKRSSYHRDEAINRTYDAINSAIDIKLNFVSITRSILRASRGTNSIIEKKVKRDKLNRTN